MTDPRLALATRMGVLPGFRDLTGTWRETSVETAEALLAAMGVAPDARPEVIEAGLPIDLICEAGAAPDHDFRDTPWTLVLETGEEMTGEGALPPCVRQGRSRPFFRYQRSKSVALGAGSGKEKLVFAI